MRRDEGVRLRVRLRDTGLASPPPPPRSYRVVKGPVVVGALGVVDGRNGEGRSDMEWADRRRGVGFVGDVLVDETGTN